MMTSASFFTSTLMPSAKILHQSIVNRDVKTIKRILKGQQSWKVIDNEGDTVLHLTFKCKINIFSRQESIIRTLECFLNEGLSVNLKNATGQTVLFLAVKNRLRHVTDYLVQHGANMNVCDQNGNSIIHILIEDQFKRYYENCIINGGYSLRQFVEQEDIDFMNWLLSRGVDLDIQNNDEKTALDLAMERNLQHVMPILINHMNNVNHIDENGCTIIELIFEARTKLNATRGPIPSCIYQYCYDSSYDIEIVRLLLDKGVSVDHVNNRGNTLVHKFLKSYDPSPEIIRRMFQRYTNVNAQDQDGNTALHLVIRDSLGDAGHHKNSTLEFVLMLLDKGTNVHLKNEAGDTAVGLAFRVKHFEVMKTLFEYGADVSPFTNRGSLFLHDISSVPSIKDQIWAPMVDTLVQVGWNVNVVRPGDHYTPLMEACRSRCPAIAQKLIDNGANVNYVEKKSLMRPIHVAAIGSRANKHENPAALFKILAKVGAKVNVKNGRGETALHLASHCSYSAVKMLLNLGGNVDAKDNSGCLTLHKAVEKGNVIGIKALLEFGADFNDEGVLNRLDFKVKRGRDCDIENRTADYLTQHWLKLKAANLPVIDGFAGLAKKNSFQEFYVECLIEVETLKAYHLNERITLYDLLHMDVNFKYIFMANNQRLKELVQSPLLKETFPKYHILLLACYNKAVARYPLVKPAKKVWNYLTGTDLPDCVERILAYLENEDLRAMAEVENVVNSLKRLSQLTLDAPAKKKRLTR